MTPEEMKSLRHVAVQAWNEGRIELLGKDDFALLRQLGVLP